MAQAPINVRRKPRQSRAKFTQQALLETTVQLLREKSFDEITIREITEIAGVGLGTFYEYFSQKEDVIALIIHQYIKMNIQQLQQLATAYLSDHHDLNIAPYLRYLIEQQILMIKQEQRIWATIFLLERQLSSVEIYQKHYELMTQHWQTLITFYFPQPVKKQRAAQNLHRILYGFVMQSLLIQPDFRDWENLQQDIITASLAFITTRKD
ncbi:MAG: TetR/AcrR family transcriptional regulator [Acinetobacter populi]|jgi:AcrR family transcriptional regulator|uniref:TetR/AcrR family transcriptional regulator n=1 Tax=Acinetobacter populi TaxID=1582270 RepID=UPI002357C27F|nr:TetR/AcrR family transcriptional regulator [Acinetobacter populi]MCH4248015.1 TetR/AcrR family transcriptional regulator [Acinetobacter populi]